jgi:molybdopterin-guanine dinucleotide biosynthesis protein A
MGTPKAQLEIGGATFEELVLGAAAAAFDEVVAVERAGGKERSVRTIFEEPREERGAAFGLARAFADAGEQRLWLLGVDFPLVTGALLRDLRERFERSAASILVPWWDGEPQMLSAGYGPAAGQALARAIEEEDLRLRGLLGRVGAEHVSEEEIRARHAGEPLLNVNQPADLERARKIHDEAHASRR